MKETIRTWLTGQFGPDEALLGEIYGLYAADMRKMSAELDGLLSEGNLARLGERGHAMKGMALQVGDEELSALCLKLQDAGRGADAAGCAAAVPAICDAVAAL